MILELTIKGSGGLFSSVWCLGVFWPETSHYLSRTTIKMLLALTNLEESYCTKVESSGFHL